MQSRIGNSLVALVFLWGLQPGALAQQGEFAPQGGDSSLTGKVLGVDGKSPMAGAKIMAYHLSTEQVFTSTVTGNGGEYRIENLPYGYFDLAVQTPDGLFVGNQVINLPPSSKAAVVFSIAEFETPPADGDPRGRDFPGSTQPSMGLASVTEKPRGRDFWRSPKGVAILGGAGALTLLVLAGGGGSSDPPPPSPSTP